MTMAKKTNLNINYISLPNNFPFKKQLKQLLEQIDKESLLVNRPSKKIINERVYSASIILHGLYECYCCLTSKASLSIPRHKSYYSQTDFTKITTHSHTVVMTIIDALLSLGWVHQYIGGIKKGKNVITELKPAGELLKLFESTGIVYQKPKVNSDEVIILRDRDSDKNKFNISVPETREVRLMRKNLKKLNQFIGQHAICLHMSNERLKEIANDMGRDDYQAEWDFQKKNNKQARVFNFSHVSLRRIFSRGQMNKGGRFYGGWWQFIRSEHRKYITINGGPVIEVDYSELHPRMMYLENGLKIPAGDMYDIGLEGTEAQKKSKRKIVKVFLNSLLNDESGRVKLSEEDEETLGLSTKELKMKILDKHPIMMTLLKKGVGLNYQFRDSQIAEKIMLRLMDKGILCLPVHDSFICSLLRDEAQSLIDTMKEVYMEELGDSPALKGLDLQGEDKYKTDFQIKWLPNGEMDREHMFKIHSESIHNKYVQSWRQAYTAGRQVEVP